MPILPPRVPQHLPREVRAAIERDCQKAMRKSKLYWPAILGICPGALCVYFLPILWAGVAWRAIHVHALLFAATLVMAICILVLARIKEKCRASIWQAHDVCPTCGYNLRESRKKCPECGTIRPPKKVPPVPSPAE